jgi:DNA-binding NarL/FixJ family response regulator
MKIIIADDHHLIVEGLKAAVQKSFPDFDINTSMNKQELFETLESQTTDILIQDIKFGYSNAKDFLDEIKTKFPKLKIILLSSVSDSVSIKQLSKKVDSYILKSESLDEINTAIDSIIKGKKYFSKESTKRLNEFQEDNEIVLSRREKEVLAVIMQEKSIKEIAEILFISEKTVEMHRSNLFVKLDVKNLTGLIKKAIALNLVDE